jgi:hypothetical protein
MSDTLAPIATEVIYEDDRVRVWNQVVPAGGRIEKHRHDHDYFLVNISGTGPIAVDFHNGTGGSLGEKISFVPTPGTVDQVPKGHIETAHNEGDEYRAILVELKNA